MGFKPTSGGGIDQLTGGVTAGPGTGSQAATIAPVTTAGSIGGAAAVPEITYNAAGQITGVASVAPDDTSKVPLAGGTMTGQLIVPDLSVSGLTGATAASRYVGATTSGAPTAGTFAVGDFVIDQTGKVWVCTTAGTPGTWTGVGGSSLAYGGATLGASVALAAATATTVFSQALGVGTYLIHTGITISQFNTATANVELQLAYAIASGTVSVVGYYNSQSVATVADGTYAKTLIMEFIAVVTAAATIDLQAYSTAAATAIANECGYNYLAIG